MKRTTKYMRGMWCGIIAVLGASGGTAAGGAPHGAAESGLGGETQMPCQKIDCNPPREPGGGRGDGTTCFDAETPILVESQAGGWRWTRASEVKAGDRLATLDPGTPLTNPVLRSRNLLTISHDSANEPLLVLIFDDEHQVDDQHQLKVTQKHPILLHDGRIVRADHVKVGNRLVTALGKVAVIRSIMQEPANQDVYNFVVDADAPMSHVIVAGGVLSPEMWWQERLANGPQ